MIDSDFTIGFKQGQAHGKQIMFEKIEDIKAELSHIDKPEPHNIGYESGVYDGVQLAIRTIDSHISGKEKE